MAGGFLPGALLGAHLAALLFFLNPELPFAAGPLLRGAIVHGCQLGLAGAVLNLLFLWRRPARARRLLPWGLTAALSLAAILDWTHASVFAFFLPPGVNSRLIRAAVWLTLGALIAFYTALLHSLHRRRYGIRSQLGLSLVVVLSLYVMLERRGAYPPPPPGPLPSSVEPAQRLSLFMVGLEGATLDAVLPLAERGHLPFLAQALRQGAYGRLTSITPNRRVALWTTLATGKYPYKHRVLGEVTYSAGYLAAGARLRLLPLGIGFRSWGLLGGSPSPAGGGAALRVWEILPRVETASGVVGWPDSAEPARSAAAAELPTFVVGERFFSGPGAMGAARPPEVAARARLFRLRPEEVDPVLAARFGADPPGVVLEALAQDLWRESLALFLLEQYRDVEALFVQLPGLGVVSRAYFGGYAEAQFEGSQRGEAQRAAEILAAYYGHLDDYLARLWERRTGPSILAVVSAHGTEEAASWRRALRAMAGGSNLEGYVSGSPDGILLLYGTGIGPGALLTDGELADVVPTLAYGMGLPIARDLDGRILTPAFERGFLAAHPLTFVPSYETVGTSPGG